MIKVVAFDLVGVLVNEKDIELSEIEEKLERMFGPNINDADYLIEARKIIEKDSIIMNITETLIDKLYKVKDREIFKKVKEKNMYKLGAYNQNNRMSDLVCDNYPVLLVMSRFGIALGFGDKSIGEVCRENGVHTETFLAVVNLLLDEGDVDDYKNVISAGALLEYLHNSHDYFLNFRLPAIRCNLLNAIDGGEKDISIAILRFFDEYVAEVQKHMRYEESTVFPYVNSLLAGVKPDMYNIAIFRKRHDQVEAKLTELKNILIKYYPASSSNELNSVLFDIFTCEQDLASHKYIEDYLFIPVIQTLEYNIERKK